MKRNNILSAFLGCAILTTSNLHAAVISSDWNDFTAGTHSWNTAAKWDSQTWTGHASLGNWLPAVTPGTVPNNGGEDSFSARIMNASANNIVVETSGSVTVGRLWLERSGAGSTTLKLGGDMIVDGTLTSGSATRPTGFNNSAASTPAGLVLDLNGHTFDASGAAATSLQNARNYTIRDTSGVGNGSFIVQNISRDSNAFSGVVNVENDLTVKLTTYASANFQNSAGSGSDPGWVFSKNSTLWFSANGSGSAVNLHVGGSEFGNVIVGSSGNTTASVYALGHSSGTNIHIQGDLTLYAGSAISMNNSAGARVGRKIFLEGNLTDETTTGADYGGRADTGGFFFVGGIDREQEVLVKRSGLTSLFSIGESETIHGNVKLLNNLTTTEGVNANSGGTGTVRVWDESRLNVNSFTLQATTVDIRNDAITAFTFGDNTSNALIKATGTLTLNTFHLELNFDGSTWTNGTDLLLFEYGTLSGTQVLSSLIGAGITYGELDIRSGQIWLTNVSIIPEPTALAFLLSGIALLALRRRRKV